MVLDEPKETDESFEFDGVTYIVDKDLDERAGEIKVDYMDEGYSKGFVLSSSNDLGGGASGCGSGCSC